MVRCCDFLLRVVYMERLLAVVLSQWVHMRARLSMTSVLSMVILWRGGDWLGSHSLLLLPRLALPYPWLAGWRGMWLGRGKEWAHQDPNSPTSSPWP